MSDLYNFKVVDFDPFAGPELEKVVPVIEPQSEIWISCLMGGEDANRSYNESVSLRLHGSFNQPAMVKSLEDLISRHEALRSTFTADGKQLCIYKTSALNLEFHDISAQTDEAQKQCISDFSKRDAQTPFDLLNGPLFRVALFKLSDKEHFLKLTAHHIVCDGWSLGILLQDLSKLYSGYMLEKSPDLSEAPQFSEYALQMRAFSESGEYRQIEQYWVNKYKDNVPVLDVPADFPRPADRTYKSHRDDYFIDKDLVASIKKVGAKAGCSLVTTLMCSFEIFLNRITGQHDIVLGLPSAGQSATGSYGLVGHCVNLLPLRSFVKPDLSFVDYLKQRKSEVLNDYDHQQLTFSSLLKRLNIKRDTSRIPLVPVVFNIDMGLDNGVEFAGLSHKLVYNPREYETFEIFLNATGSEESLILEWSYNTQLFRTESIARMMNEFESLLRAAVAEPGIKIKDIPLWSRDELSAKLAAWNNTASDYPKNKTLHELISGTAAKYAEKTAIRFENRLVKFSDVNALANQLAALLQRNGIKRGDVVGVAVDRSPEMVIALLATLKAGGAYVPLDPAYPKDRIEFMLDDSSASILLASKKYKGYFNSKAKELLIEDIWRELPSYSSQDIAVAGNGNDLAYILYTSGSTGKPKGVMVEHRNLVNLLYSMILFPGITANDKLLAVTTISFDIAGLELFLPLLSGAELVIADTDTSKDGRALLDIMEKQSISIIQATPSTYKLMLEENWTKKLNVKILCCGEPMSKDLAGKLLPRCGALYNMYGPTETTIYSTGTQIFSAEETITIGHPIHNTQVYILDEYMRPLPEGVVGEIYLAGDGVARGYLNRPELNAEKFVDDPFSHRPGAKMYRTGDLGKFMADGKIHCLGRIDHQVKIRGYRIELGEIEFNLSKQKGVKEAVVMAREDNPGDQRLVAYLVMEPGSGDTSVQDIRNGLKEMMPAFMVPGDFVFLSAFPLTPNGKIDRKALPAPQSTHIIKAEKELTETDAEHTVSKVWKEVLGVEKIGRYDDFFELGGHSLIAAQVMKRMEKETGKRLSITTLFKNPKLVQFASLFDEEKKSEPESAADEITEDISSVPEKIQATPTEPQVEIFLACMLGGEEASRSYNVSFAEFLYGRVDYKAMEKAVFTLVRRHESLRSTFTPDGNEMCIHRELPVKIYYEDYSSHTPDQQQQLIDDFCKKTSETTFDLVNGPLFKVALFKLSDEKYYFAFTAHHIICDGVSAGILLRELGLLYSAYVVNKTPHLPAAPSFAAYAAEQQEFYKGDEYAKIEEYWVERYKGEIPTLNIPIDFSRPPQRTYKGRYYLHYPAPSLIQDIKKLGSGFGCSFAITLRAIFEIFLHDITGQEDIVVGLPVSGQLSSDLEGLVGHCVNLLPIRSRLKEGTGFIDYLKERKFDLLDDYEHHQLTFSSLIKKLDIVRDNSRIPLVSVILNTTMGLDDGINFYGLKLEELPSFSGYENFELSVNAGGSEAHPVFEWAYNTQLFKESSIKQFALDFESLISRIVQNPEYIIKEFSGSENPFRKLSECSVYFPKDKTIVDLFYEQAADKPDHIAVVYQGKKLNYRELDLKSNQLANYLREKGVKEETFVGICITHSLEMIVGILGILKAGAAYVPIDPEFPPDRVSYMAEDSNAPIILTNRLSCSALSHVKDKQIIILDSEWQKIAQSPAAKPANRVLPNHLVYLIYTSGSTGRPKGVMLEHRSLVDYVYGFKANVPVEGCRSFALGSTIATDLGNTVLYSSLFLGGELHVFSKETFNDIDYIHDYFKKHSIDCLKIVPSHWKSLSPANNGLYPKKLLVFGGETLYREIVKEIESSNAGCTIVNHYGPTETTIGKLLHVVKSSADYGNTIPIGRPFSNASVYILTDAMKFSSQGVAGEIYIGGIGVARGYLNHPDLTRERFLPDPFSIAGNAFMYRTGDLGRWLPDGNIEYLGRIDDQVKIRGHRIELGEIGDILQQSPGVKQSVVIAHEDSPGDKRLVGYIVSKGKFNKDAITSFLKSKLPEYMIPRTLIEMDRIPLTANGKVDRKALPKPEKQKEYDQRNYVAPETEIQKIIAGIWSDVLGVKRIGIKDDFFELGGHSLLALRSMIAIEKHTGKKLPLAMMFENSTIERLAKLIETDEQSIKWDCFVPIKTSGNKIPIYFIHGVGLNVLTFRSISKHLDPDQPVYGLQAKGLNGKDEPLNKMEDIAAHYISEVLHHNPKGPYAIAGYSFGGLIAFEMAKQLKQMGKEVVMLGVFDTFAYQSDYYDPLPKKMLSRISEFFKKIWCTFVLMAHDPRFIVSYRTKSMWKKASAVLNKVSPFKKESDPNDFQVYSKKIIQNLLIAARDYKLTAYDGTLDLFRAKRKAYYLPDFEYLGWTPLALKGVNIHEVPGDHAEMFNPPNVEELARILQARLDKSNNSEVKNNPTNLLRAV